MAASTALKSRRARHAWALTFADWAGADVAGGALGRQETVRAGAGLDEEAAAFSQRGRSARTVSCVARLPEVAADVGEFETGLALLEALAGEIE